MLMTPFRCWRNRDDCEPLHSIEATPEGMTPEQFESPDFTPKSFVCCGINHSGSREVAQDCYRLCFKNETGDEMTDNDLQDLTHVAAVITQALAITATRMVNGGTVQVPAMQGDDKIADEAAHLEQKIAANHAMRAMPAFSGDCCMSCGNFTLVRSGTCFTCATCGTTSGCS